MFYRSLLCLTILVASGLAEDVIDLQQLLLDVSTLMKKVEVAMGSCKDISPDKPSTRGKPRDCADLWYSGIRNNGVYRVWPESWQNVGSFEVYCDMTTDGGGWTVFQKRGQYDNPQDYFYKTWTEYKQGFGDMQKEFWLGNDRIFALTNQDSYEMRVDMLDMDLKSAYAKYKSFWIENEVQQYRVKISGYSGNAGDSLQDVSGAMFSTKDRKNDVAGDNWNCAQEHKGAWWYVKCHGSNLNGLNLRGQHQSYADGINWKTFRGHNYSVSSSQMKIRPADFYTRF